MVVVGLIPLKVLVDEEISERKKKKKLIKLSLGLAGWLMTGTYMYIKEKKMSGHNL